MILAVTVAYGCLLSFSLFFLTFFSYTVWTYKHKGRIPIVYICIMIFCNTIEVVTSMFQHSSVQNTTAHVSLDIGSGAGARPGTVVLMLGPVLGLDYQMSIGKPVSLIDGISYFYPIFLTMLMVIERYYIILFPFGKAFSNRRLMIYSAILAIILISFFLFLFFSECPHLYDFVSTTYLAPTKCTQWIFKIVIMFNWSIPVTCMFLNFGLIFHLSFKQRQKGIGMSGSSANRSREMTKLIQAVANTISLLICDCALYISIFLKKSNTDLKSPIFVFLFYGGQSTTDIVCFLVYFIATPVTRRLILEKMNRILKRKKTEVIIVNSVAEL